jgi:hypothetical protein
MQRTIVQPGGWPASHHGVGSAFARGVAPQTSLRLGRTPRRLILRHGDAVGL